MSREKNDGADYAARGFLSMFFGSISWFWWMVLSAGACIVAITAGFMLTRYFTTGIESPLARPDQAIAEGQMLRGYSNELMGLAADLSGYAATGWEADPQEGRVWLSDTFDPQLRDLRRRLIATADRHPALSSMLLAADRLAHFATDPTSDRARQDMHDAVLQAVNEAESAISEMGVSHYLTEPALVPAL